MVFIKNNRINEVPIFVESIRRTVLLEHYFFLELGSFEVLKDVAHLVCDFLFQGDKFVILPFYLFVLIRFVVDEVFAHWRVNRQEYLESEKCRIDFVFKHGF